MNENILKKFCPKCEVEKSLEEFVKNRARSNGRGSYCKSCHNDIYKRYDKSNPFKTSMRHRKAWLKRLYGITLEQYNELLQKQNNRCSICGALDSNSLRGKLFVDHSHKTNQVRGLLCNSCNKLLGDAKDNIDILESAISYLKRNF